MDDTLVAAPLAGWLTPLADVPDAVFADRLMGDGVGIDPVAGVVRAPCAATLLSIHPAHHAVTLRTPGGAELLIHVGIDTMALDGVGFIPLATPGTTVRQGDPLLAFDLDMLVRRARAVVTPVIVTNSDSFAVVALGAEGLVAIGDPLFRIVAREGASAAAQESSGPLVRRDVVIALAHGLHARPAARLAAAARGFAATVELSLGTRRAAARSTVGLLGLGAGHGATVAVEARGPDAAAAVDALARLLTDDSAEAPAPAAVPATPLTIIDAPGLPGVPAAPGLAVGPAAWLRQDADVIDIPAASDGSLIESQRLEQALTEVGQVLAAQNHGGTRGAVIAAHGELLSDPTLTAEAFAGIAAGHGAAAAYRAAIRAQAATLAASGDRRIAERADDLRDIEGRVLRAILGLPQPRATIPPGAILLAREVLPSQMIALDPGAVAGIALIDGGSTSHVAILAAGMGIPMVVALGSALSDTPDGTMLVLDADQGVLDVDPPADRLDLVRERLADGRARAAAARADAHAPSHSADGTRIEVFANLGTVSDAETAVGEGAEGCGLLRTEFLFLDRAVPPTVAEQHADYQAIADRLGDRPLIVRLLDVGGDKPAPYLAIAPEENPALGLRGVRVALARPDILDAQLRAILTVTPPGRCRIMVPMVASVEELDAVRAATERLRRELGIAAEVAIGAMVETPAAALCADLLAQRAAFLSIGSNDLTQYALARDRGNPAVAAGADGLHPAVLRLIGMTCTGAAARAVPVGVCGALAADPLAVPILLGLGVTELSVPPARIAAVKALVARLSLDACRDHARAALGLASPQAVRAHAAAFAQGIIA